MKVVKVLVVMLVMVGFVSYANAATEMWNFESRTEYEPLPITGYLAEVDSSGRTASFTEPVAVFSIRDVGLIFPPLAPYHFILLGGTYGPLIMDLSSPVSGVDLVAGLQVSTGYFNIFAYLAGSPVGTSSTFIPIEPASGAPFGPASFSGASFDMLVFDTSDPVQALAVDNIEVTFGAAATPEPASMIIFGLAMAGGWFGAGYSKKKKP